MPEDIKAQVEAANSKALSVILSGRPVWVDVKPALEVVPGMTKNTVPHFGRVVNCLLKAPLDILLNGGGSGLDEAAQT